MGGAEKTGGETRQDGTQRAAGAATRDGETGLIEETGNRPWYRHHTGGVITWHCGLQMWSCYGVSVEKSNVHAFCCYTTGWIDKPTDLPPTDGWKPTNRMSKELQEALLP